MCVVNTHTWKREFKRNVDFHIFFTITLKRVDEFDHRLGRILHAMETQAKVADTTFVIQPDTLYFLYKNST